MKKALFWLFILVLSISVFAACDEAEEPHVCEFGEWSTVKEASCSERSQAEKHHWRDQLAVGQVFADYYVEAEDRIGRKACEMADWTTFH